jgi:hypothetical protein
VDNNNFPLYGIGARADRRIGDLQSRNLGNPLAFVKCGRTVRRLRDGNPRRREEHGSGSGRQGEATPEDKR